MPNFNFSPSLLAGSQEPDGKKRKEATTGAEAVRCRRRGQAAVVFNSGALLSEGEEQLGTL